MKKLHRVYPPGMTDEEMKAAVKRMTDKLMKEKQVCSVCSRSRKPAMIVTESQKGPDGYVHIHHPICSQSCMDDVMRETM